jgi:hypothetical protein
MYNRALECYDVAVTGSESGIARSGRLDEVAASVGVRYSTAADRYRLRDAQSALHVGRDLVGHGQFLYSSRPAPNSLTPQSVCVWAERFLRCDVN